MCEVLSEPEGLKEGGREEGLPYFKRLRLNFSTSYYSMAHRLGLKRLQELFQVGIFCDLRAEALWTKVALLPY